MSTETALSRFVKDRYHEVYEKPPTARGLARESGDLFTYNTAAKILNGSHGAPSEPVIQGLALVLRSDLGLIRQLAGLAPHSLGPFVLPDRAARLSRRQRDAVIELIDVILEAQAERQPTEKERAAAAAAARAARSTESTVTLEVD